MKAAYDVIVIGGGVNGCGIARDCAMRGLRVLLLEKKDLSSGTTGACSGMIHGGLRYLSSDRNTTRLSCLDSGYIQKIAPFLIFRIPFIFPFLRDGEKPSLFDKLFHEAVEAYFTAYDKFQPLKSGKPHTRLTPAEVAALDPNITAEIDGAVTIDEWGIDTFRLCVLNALSAARHGADVKTYTKVTDLLKDEDGRVRGVSAKDEITGERSELHARAVCNAAGPWGPKVAAAAGARVRIRPGKGVHLTFARRLSNYGVIFNAVDGRQVFLMPHENVTILGTTDDDYYGDLDNIPITTDEVSYLLEAASTVYPKIREERIIRAWAGVRCTLFEYGRNEDALSRAHRIFDHGEIEGVYDFFSISGGKLASYRIMSQQMTDVLAARLGVDAPCRTHLEPLPGAIGEISAERWADTYKLPVHCVERMIYRHGTTARRILSMLDDNRALASIVCRCEGVIEAEARYCIRNEWVRKVEDLRRRCRVGAGPCQGCGCARRAAEVLADELAMPAGQIPSLAFNFLRERWRGNRPVLRGAQLAQEELSRSSNYGVADMTAFAKPEER